MKLQAIWSAAEDNNKERGTSLIGRVVYRHCQEPLKTLGFALSTAHLIGYDPKKGKKDRGYYTFVSLSDGMTAHCTLAELIERLNEGCYVPIPGSVLRGIMEEKQPLQ